MEHHEKLRASQAELSLSQQEIQDLKAQLNLLHADATRFQTTAKQAFANYERELQLHAISERSLKESQETIDSLRSALAAAEHRVARLSTDLICLERRTEEDKQHAITDSIALKEQLAELTRTNELLHSQVQTYGAQIERLLEHRSEGAAGGGGEASGMDGTSSSNPKVSVTAEEINELKKSLSELREVLRYMKKEKDLLLAKQSVLESENARHVMEVHFFSLSLLT